MVRCVFSVIGVITVDKFDSGYSAEYTLRVLYQDFDYPTTTPNEYIGFSSSRSSRERERAREREREREMDGWMERERVREKERE
jgi:hypothetical protein